jgi:hypothetical protein
VIANFLVSAYKGHVVIPDFGFYACPFHRRLLRQGRLIAGVNSLSEVPWLKDSLHLFDKAVPSKCGYDDAVVFAKHAGLVPDPMRDDSDYNKYVRAAVGGTELPLS